jgi:hypothetical protein
MTMAFPLVLLAQARHRTAIACVLADAELDSERNHRFIRQDLGATSMIPAKRGNVTWHLHGIRAQMRADFPRFLYRLRFPSVLLLCLEDVNKARWLVGHSSSPPLKQFFSVWACTCGEFTPSSTGAEHAGASHSLAFPVRSSLYRLELPGEMLMLEGPRVGIALDALPAYG